MGFQAHFEPKEIERNFSIREISLRRWPTIWSLLVTVNGVNIKWIVFFMLTSRFSSSLGVYVLRFSCFLRRPNFMVLSALYLNISRRGIEMLDEKLFSVLHKFKHNPLLLSTSIKTFLFEVMQWIAKTIQVICSSMLLLFMHFILTPRLKLLIRMSFRMSPTCLVLFFIVTFVIILF